MENSVKLYVVVPCYNEEEVLPETSKQMLELFGRMKDDGLISSQSRIIFIDDGSKDKTWSLIYGYSMEHKEIGGIKLAHNAGHQNALLSGLMTVKDQCDCAISIDADLQDDINVIPEMVRKFRDEGCDVVYGVRNKRDTDTFFKRTTAEGFYHIMQAMGVNVVFNHADYRLMSARALKTLSEFPERNLFLRGMVPLVGYKSDCVYYSRHERFAGESKYPLKKMLSLAWEGVTSLSIKPIRFVTILGAIVFAISIILLFYSLFSHFWGNTVPGWTSLAVSIWAIGGLQLLAIGIIGEYLGKIYMETKQRPRYFIETFLNDEPETEDRSQ